MRALLVAGIISLVLLAFPAWAGPSSGTPKYFGKLEILVTTVENTEINFASKDVIELLSAAEPPGFTLKTFRVEFLDGMPSEVVPISYESKSVDMGIVESLSSSKGVIKLASNNYNGTVKVRLITVFSKSRWIELKAGKTTIDLAEFSSLDLKNVTFRFSIDNYAPFAIVGLKSPDGRDLLSQVSQEDVNVDYVKFDPKHVEVNAAELGLGRYILEIAGGEEYVMPNAFIAAEEEFLNITIPAKSTKTLTVKRKSGWKTLGAIVVLYSVTPGPLSDNVKVEGRMIDLAYKRGEEFEISGASLMIPPLEMSYWIKAYLVFGESVRVTNNEGHEVHAIIVPVNIKETGTWTKKGLIVKVTKEDLRGIKNGFIVVQLPPNAKIRSIVLPNGDTIKGIERETRVWMGSFRRISIGENEAIIQVKGGNTVDEGQYLFEIEWEPLKIKLVDADGNPIAGADVIAEGPINVSATSDERGIAELRVYSPGAYKIFVNFKGSKVAETFIGTLVNDEATLRCNVYNLEVEVKSMLGSPVGNAAVTVSNKGGFKQTLITDSTGKATFAQLPGGNYEIDVKYKRIASSESYTVSKSGKKSVSLDMIFDLPVIGPISGTEVAAVGTASVATLAFWGLRRGKKKKEYIELEDEDTNDF